MTRSVRAAALRSTALATVPGARRRRWRSRRRLRAKVPLPKPRPIARNVVPATTSAAAPATRPQAQRHRRPPTRTDCRPFRFRPRTRPAAAPLAPPPRPPPSPRASRSRRPRSLRPRRPRRPTRTRWKTSSSSCASASRTTPPRPKPRSPIPWRESSREWLILRSDDNNVTVERYRAFISANPSWPSQTFLRRRLEAALWDDKRDDAAIWSWFENESPISAKGRLALAKAMLARGDRANAERLVREAWRSDPMSEDTESSALDMFGALLTRGRPQGADGHPALRHRERGGRHARRQAPRRRLCRAGQGAHRRQPQGRQPQGPARRRAARAARRSRLSLREDPAAAPRGEIRRSRPADDERAEGSGPPAQSRRMVDRAAAAGAQDDRHRRIPHRLSDRARRGAALPRHLQDRAGIHRRLDRAALPQRSRRSPRSILPASASAASIRPRWRAPATGRAAPRKPPAARRRRAPPIPAPPSNRPAITASSRAPSSACRRSS